MKIGRRGCLASLGLGTAAAWTSPLVAAVPARQSRDLTIKAVRVTPVALPDPPLLAASGCHGPYFLRNIVEVDTADGVTGIGETHGGEETTNELLACRESIVGRSAAAVRGFSAARAKGDSVYAGIELACLDAVGRATGLRLCELLGGPTREEVEFSSYLFYRYAADDSRLLADRRLVDDRGRGDRALDTFGEVRTPEAMAELAAAFHARHGFRIHKLKGGVLPPDVELDTLRAMHARLGDGRTLRIDPNARWRVETAVRIGESLKDLPLEYYEDPVRGQADMAEVRRRCGLPMSTNMCVTQFDHIAPAIATRPVDIVLCDHHGWGGLLACQALGQMCETLGWGMSQHSNNHAGITMAAMTHLAAATPHLKFASDTHYPWLVEGADLLEGPNLKFKDGKMTVPTGAGVGVELDRDKLARANETYEKCGMRGRDDRTTMRMVEPSWTGDPF